MVNARQIHEHLRSLDTGWVDWRRTTDRCIFGDPERELAGAAVGWMSYTWALRRAHELGCTLFITHEPTYFSGHDYEDRIFRFPVVRAKRAWIEKSGIVLLRCHDM